MHEIAVVIPAYNEEATIRAVASEALAVCPDVIVVDDGSTDATQSALDGLPITLIVHPDNQGKARSLWDGLERALESGAKAVITLDGDGQHRPEDIPRLLEAWRRNPGTIVIGSRLADKSAFPPARYYANRFANFWISWASGYSISDSQSGFRLYPAELLSRLKPRLNHGEGFVFESEVLIDAAHLGYRSTSVPVRAIYEQGARPSHFRGVRDIALITRMVAGKLLSRGMYPRGLYRVLVTPHFSRERLRTMGSEGVTTLLLALVVMTFTAGISLLIALAYTLRIAHRAPSDVDSEGRQLVLGQRLRNDAVGPAYAARLTRAWIRWRKNPARAILILGGKPSGNQVSEAQAGRDYLVHLGMPLEHIEIEQQSRNTLENLRHARDALKDKDSGASVVIITNRYHLARSGAMAKGLGLAYTLCAAEDRLSIDPWLPFQLLKEAFHVHWYYVGSVWARLTRNKRMLARIR